MRILLLGAAAIALSGCSWLKGSGHDDYQKSSDYGHYSSSSDDCCVGGKTLSRWNLEGGIGPSFMLGGDAITGDKINTFPNAVVSAPDLSMDDVYGTGYRAELGGSYALNPNRKVTVLGNYTQHEGSNINLGSVNDALVSGTMGDYTSYGVEAGLRQYFQPTSAPIVKSIRPYVEGRLGGAYVDDIALENATIRDGSGPAAFQGGTVGLYEGGWVPTGAGLIGIEAPIFERATLGLETGVRYTGTLASDRSILGGSDANTTNGLIANGLAGANNGSSNWSVPVMLRGRYRF